MKLAAVASQYYLLQEILTDTSCSNGIRFTISDLSPPRSRLLPAVYRERAGISLYDALHEDVESVFSAKTIRKVAETLSRFSQICEDYNVPRDQITVFATEAMRTAHNQDEMLEAIHSACGLDVQILSPAMESMFGAMGARAAFGDVRGLFMDLGGGSVQMTYLNSQDPGYEALGAASAKSLPYGAAKVTASLSALEAHAQEKLQDDLAEKMQHTFESMKDRFPALQDDLAGEEGVHIYFCGGGFRGYGSMLMHKHKLQPYPIPEIGGFTVTGKNFIDWETMLAANDDKGKIFGLSKRRRQQFPAIVMVVKALVEAVPKISKVTFCCGGNRDGVLYMKLPPKLRDQHPLPLLPGGLDSATDDAVDAILEVVVEAFPSIPGRFSDHLLKYIIRNTWIHLGHSDDENATKALHNPVSGAIAGLPGLTHDVQATISLVLYTRWAGGGGPVAPVDFNLHRTLRHLLSKKDQWIARYTANVMRFLATIFPAFPADPATISKALK